jgi:hypothetical protein
MSYRRILYLGQFAAAIALPAWVLIARGLLDDTIGWELLVYIIACPFLSIAMLAAGGLIAARHSARTARAVSGRDAILLTAWYAAIIAYGLWAWSALAVAIVILAGAVFITAAVTLFTETRARFRGLVAGFEQAAQPPASPTVPGAQPRVIVIAPDDPTGPR